MWQHQNGECPAKWKICTKCRKLNHFAKVCKSININVINYEDDNTLEYINSCDSKVQSQKFIANIKIDDVKVKFLINIGSSPNILCYETLKVQSCKLKKTLINDGLLFFKRILKISHCS